MDKADDIVRAMHEAETIDGAQWQNKTLALMENVIRRIYELEDYWPLTVRQAFYQAVAKLWIPNKTTQYSMLSERLTSLRREEILPWGVIEDRTRRTVDKRGIANVSEFIKGQVSRFLNPELYGRCYVQNQDYYVEVATEKEALATIFENAVWAYCVRLNVVRGQVSATMVNSIANRFEEASYQGKEPILLYFGDHDPSGEQIPIALGESLEKYHHVDDCVIRIALNSDQISKYKLPTDPDAVKQSDPNYGEWLRKFGFDEPAVELDALNPQDLENIIGFGLEEYLDVSDIQAEYKKEQEERKLLKKMRHRVLGFMKTEWPDLVDLDD